MMIQIYRSLQTCFLICRRAASGPEQVRGARTWHIETRSILGNGKSLLGFSVRSGRSCVRSPRETRRLQPFGCVMSYAEKPSDACCEITVTHFVTNFTPNPERVNPPPSTHPPWARLPSWRRCPPTTSATSGSRVVGCVAEMLSSTRTPGCCLVARTSLALRVSYCPPSFPLPSRPVS